MVIPSLHVFGAPCREMRRADRIRDSRRRPTNPHLSGAIREIVFFPRRTPSDTIGHHRTPPVGQKGNEYFCHPSSCHNYSSEPFRTIPNHSEVKKWRVISPNLSEVIRSCPKPSGRSIFFGTVDVFVPPPIFRNGYGVTGRIGRICLAECARPRAQQWASGDPA